MGDIIVPPGQPIIPAKPKGGDPITADQFAMDFDVDVGAQACYVVVFRLLAKVKRRLAGVGEGAGNTFKYDTETVLEDTAKTVTPLCLAKGKTKFHVGISTPAVGGQQPLPTPANAKTITLAGSWPRGESAAFTFEITVYKIGPCVNGTCAEMQRAALDKATKYAVLEGPRKAPSKPDDRPELSPMDRTLGSRALEFGPEKCCGHAAQLALPETRLTRTGRLERSAPFAMETDTGRYSLCYACSAQTLYERAILIEWWPRGAAFGAAPTVSIPCRPLWPSLAAAGRALRRIETALANNRLATVGGLRLSFRTHGLAIVPRQELAMCVPCLDGMMLPALFPLVSMDIQEIADKVLNWLLDDDDEDAEPEAGEDDFWIIIDEDWEEHYLTQTAAYAWAILLGWSIFGPDGLVDGFKAFTDGLKAYRAKNKKRCIHRLQILGHGGFLWSRGSGALIGSTIDVGSKDKISSEDFDDNGNLLPTAQNTKDLLDALKAALCPKARVTFSACNQGVGSLLQNISKYLDNGITVDGHSGLGAAFVPGDMSFVDGVRQ
jgi:hypothetical protein